MMWGARFGCVCCSTQSRSLASGKCLTFCHNFSWSSWDLGTLPAGTQGTSDVWLPLLSPVVRICYGVIALLFTAGTQHPCPALPVHDATPRTVPAPLGRGCPVPGSLQRLRNLPRPWEQHPRGCHRARAGWCPPAHPHGAGLGRADGLDPPHSWGFAFQGCPWLLTSLHTPKSWQASAPRC